MTEPAEVKPNEYECGLCNEVRPMSALVHEFGAVCDECYSLIWECPHCGRHMKNNGAGKYRHKMGHVRRGELVRLTATTRGLGERPFHVFVEPDGIRRFDVFAVHPPKGPFETPIKGDDHDV